MSTDDPAVFDPNTWYQLSEARVDIGGKELKHNLVISDSPISFGVLPNDKNYWQFVPVDEDVENRWFMRSQKTGTNRHLATCWHPEEKHEAKTRLCIALADDDAENQMWESYKWDDGAEGVRFINVKNGSDWWLDVHKGNPPFMNDDIDMDDYKPAQRWFVSSMSAVEEESFIIGDVSAVSVHLLLGLAVMTVCVRVTYTPHRRRPIPQAPPPQPPQAPTAMTRRPSTAPKTAKQITTATGPRPVSLPAHPQALASG